jgi:putative ABC transport system permease protein
MRLNTLTIALKSLRRNRARTILTVLGIVIGITSVITVMSAGNGLRSLVVGQVQKFGMDLVQIEIKVPSTSHVSAQNAEGLAMGIQVTTLTLEDSAAVRKVPNIKGNYGSAMGQEILSYKENNKQSMIWGVEAFFSEIDTTGLSSGRFFTEEEDKSLANVAIIGQTVKDKFFGSEDPLNKIIKVGKEKFRVIGVMNKRGSMAFFDMDNMIYMPVRTLQEKIMGIHHLTMITNKVVDKSIADETVVEVQSLLRQRHKIDDPAKDDFSVISMDQAMEIYDTIFGAINLLLIAIAAISLIVGGVGIMNIMYVSVTERTYEIGLRKSFGATFSNILWQFLWESIVITILGAIIGFFAGVILSYAVSVVAVSQGLEWRFMISVNSVFLSLGATFLIGLVFGVFPALTAAKLDPVTALRTQQ